ncbi:MAG: glucose-6-phosphate isomerase [Dongiaceae bacterium]
MPASTATPAWQALQSHAKTLARIRLADLFAQDPGRAARFTLGIDGLAADFSKCRITNKTLDLLQALGREADLARWIERLFSGEAINTTEGRAAMHMALRAGPGASIAVNGEDVMPAVRTQLARVESLSTAIRSGTHLGFDGRAIRHVVVIGIGGSYLGPALAVEALAGVQPTGPQIHFLANVDGGRLEQVLFGLQPATTLFVVISKSFTTAETRINAEDARAWFLAGGGRPEDIAQHFLAISNNEAAAAAFGIAPERMLSIWDWVGGRYSLWSAVGLPVAIAHGYPTFEALLDGAADMDAHFRSAPLTANLPVLLALLGLWHNVALGAETAAVVPYDSGLEKLPAYLQQLVMESNGKGVDRNGRPVTMPTAPVIWGGIGTEVQHAFMQALHQGPRLLPVEFIGVLEDRHGRPKQHLTLLANLIGQAEALMLGHPDADPAKASPGNRPSIAILLDRLDARSLGLLLALYEHRTFVEGVIWNINSFDQWGVELGKRLAQRIFGEIAGETPGTHDASTAALIARVRAVNPAD